MSHKQKNKQGKFDSVISKKTNQKNRKQAVLVFQKTELYDSPEKLCNNNSFSNDFKWLMDGIPPDYDEYDDVEDNKDKIINDELWKEFEADTNNYLFGHDYIF